MLEDIKIRSLNTAVLLIVFNRQETTRRVFEAIRKAKPPKLYIAADGPRKNIDGEKEKVQSVRDYVISQIDWKCEVSTLFRKENFGCKFAVSIAINWFFDNEEMGIILEDDCVPNQDFFWFCEELLDFYANDSRISQISGSNLIKNYKIDNYSYHFSNFGSIWGWASWRRAWNNYDIDMKGWPEIRENGYLKSAIVNKNEYKSRVNDFEKTYHDKIDTWDYQWIYSRLINRGLIIIPSVNLMSNIGLDNNATHTIGSKKSLHDMKTYKLSFPLVHPKHLLPDIRFEALIHKAKKNSLIRRVLNRIIKLIK